MSTKRYEIVKGFVSFETENGGREIKKAGDVVELDDATANRYMRSLRALDTVSAVSVVTINADDVMPVQESANEGGTVDLSDLADEECEISDAEQVAESAVDWSYIHGKKADLVLGIVRTSDISNLPSLRAVEMLNPSGPRARIISAIDKRLAVSSATSSAVPMS